MKYIISEDQLRKLNEMTSPVKVGVAMKTTGPDGDLYKSFFKEFSNKNELEEWINSINEGGEGKKIIGLINIKD